MQKIVVKQSLLAIAVLFAVAVGAPVVVSALPERAQNAQSANQEQRKTAHVSAEDHADDHVEDRKTTVQARLTEARLKVCEKRQKAITNIMSRIATRGQKQLDLFTTIAERTQQFYTDKGKTLENYDELVAEVGFQKDAAQEAVDAIKDKAVEFKCDGENPKGFVAEFKESLRNTIDVLNAYKTAVKNLIVGVKSVQGTTSSEGSEQ